MTEFFSFYLNWLLFILICAIGCGVVCLYAWLCEWLGEKYDGGGFYFVFVTVVFIFAPGFIFLGKLFVGGAG